ncbi:S41 family peptidase [Microbispora sp. KK1-11]|uniref:S41 family peptidase n=1 Tax=Microbispora sp. KK1-11 TaxID=2053005 RepID=UPI001158E19D|nr:S41 family peptidase [Microbispora sp. KK1-11]TQS29418.1 peptidase [Microbispora sp. KK1-11]
MTTARTMAAGVVLFLTAACTAQTPPRAQPSATAAGGSAVCAEPRGNPPPETPTTIDVVEQAYFCILANYYSGATLDARSLLSAGFTAFTQELNRSGRDSPEATMPALTGDREADWAAFEAAYRRVTDRLPDDAHLRERLAEATLQAIVAGLGDDHARWNHGGRRPPASYDGDQYGLGLRASAGPQVSVNPGTALPPLFVTDVLGGPAKAAGLRPGDVVESVNGSAPFIGQAVTPAAVAALYPRYPEAGPVRLRLLRQKTGRRWTVTLKPGLYQPDPAAVQVVTSELLQDGIAYVRLSGFAPDVANRVFRAISRMRTGRTLTGVVLDLRGNGGGSPDEANRLLGGFAHGKITAYQCTASLSTGDGACAPMRTDDSVPLLGLPLVVLTDRGCASACEHFSSAVKDLHLGQLVGTRTAGAVSGPARPYLLGDNTTLTFPSTRHLAPDREVIDRVGVAPDHHVPLTPQDAAAGRDPALDEALNLLHK